jgi:ribose/xylose/arabinose/galactoside ABC-type transport system permease subunit
VRWDYVPTVLLAAVQERRRIVGVLIVMVLDVGMNMIGINPWFQQAVYGMIIILAVALTIDRSRISIIK